MGPLLGIPKGIRHDLGDTARGLRPAPGPLRTLHPRRPPQDLEYVGLPRLPWTVQRENAAHIVGSMDAFYANVLSSSVLGQGAGWDGGVGYSAC